MSRNAFDQCEEEFNERETRLEEIREQLGVANTDAVIKMARRHVGNNAVMESSARLCLADAVALYDKGDWKHAKGRALESLAYSIGILHPDYKKVAK